MNRTAIVFSSVALLMLLVGGVGTAGAATPGFAVYKVQLNSQGVTDSLTVNETVATTSSPSYDNLILSIVTASWNSSYSRSINSSSDVSPFVPSITNQTFTYGSATGSLSATIVKNGTIPLQFQGASYSLTSYSLNTKAVYNGSTSTDQGALSAFPSGLVYSAALKVTYPSLLAAGLQGLLGGLNSSSIAINGFGSSLPGPVTASIGVTLLSTSLPLKSSSASAAAQVVSIGIGAGAVVSALAIGLGVRYGSKNKTSLPEEKPEHWVD
jgi:hypothetical protein